jgi:hypothetical protein
MANRDDLGAYIDRVTGSGKRPPRVCTIERYLTPSTRYPKWRQGSAAITARHLGPGIYPCSGVRDCDFYQLTHRSRMTALEIDHRVWVIDEPWHWWSVRDTAEKIGTGARVLVGGLGLGLIVHALAEVGARWIEVIERNPDVIDLVGQFLPEDAPVGVSPGDVRLAIGGYAMAGAFDAAFLDLWVTERAAETRRVFEREVLPLATEASRLLGGIPVYTIGYRGSEPIIAEGA